MICPYCGQRLTHPITEDPRSRECTDCLAEAQGNEDDGNVGTDQHPP